MAHSVLASNSSEINVDRFTPEFKRMKARKPPPNLENVIDLHLISSANGSLNSFSQENQIVKRHLVTGKDLSSVTGLKASKDWVVFEFMSAPGFFVIVNPFIPGYQKYWASRCVQDFPSDKANITNMTSQHGFDPDTAWNSFAQRSTLEKNDPLRKLRWTTLGYHHDWNTKEYSEASKAEFPADVHLLAEYIAAVLGFGPYSAQAAIVNYYHMDSTLAGHTDHSEIDLAAPLISISFGQTAIFLLGGETKSIEPIALYLRSGDICVMSGPSRLAYHAVPKILPPWSSIEAKRLENTFAFSEPLTEFQNHVTEQSVSKKAFCGAAASDISSVVGKAPYHSEVSQTQTSDFVNYTIAVSDTPHCKQACKMEAVHSGTGCDKSDSPLDTDNPYCNPNYMLRLEEVNSQILKTVATQDFKPLERYLASSRINLNIRQVLPAGYRTLTSTTEEISEVQSKKLKIFDSDS